jgi:hypothetical protein
MGEWLEKVDVVGLDDLTQSMRDLIRKYPDRAGEFLREEARRTRKEIVNNAKSSMKTDTKNRMSLGRVGSYRISQVQGYGENQYVEISARSPHFHLLERGHALVRQDGRTIKVHGKKVKIRFKDGGSTIGHVSGKFFLKKAKDAEAERFIEAADDLVDELLKESGLI